MILYHGSTEIVTEPEIRKGELYLDFGVGFYTTSSYEQAERWAKIKMRRNNVEMGFVSVYDFDVEEASKYCNVKRFVNADKQWLEFVVSNRKGEENSTDVDMHIGPVADDNVYQTIRLFETGVYDAEYTVTKLKTEVLHDQWAFHSNKILKYVTFVKARKVE